MNEKEFEMKTLKSNKEIADGTIYDSPLTTSWRAPTWILEKGKDYWNKVRSKMKIIGMGKRLSRTTKSRPIYLTGSVRATNDLSQVT